MSKTESTVEHLPCFRSLKASFGQITIRSHNDQDCRRSSNGVYFKTGKLSVVTVRTAQNSKSVYGDMDSRLLLTSAPGVWSSVLLNPEKRRKALQKESPLEKKRHKESVTSLHFLRNIGKIQMAILIDSYWTSVSSVKSSATSSPSSPAARIKGMKKLILIPIFLVIIEGEQNFLYTLGIPPSMNEMSLMTGKEVKKRRKVSL